MALDYSKLSDEELDAIARNDYSKLSDKTLRAISNDPAARKPAAPVDRGFTAPLKEMNVEDWKKSSLLYPGLQMVYGLLPFQGKQGEQAFVQGTKGVKEKGDVIVEGVKNIIQNPVQTAQAAYTAITERPGETAGNLVKGIVYDPQLLFTPVPGAKQAGQAVAATGRAAVNTAKTVGGAVAAVPDVARGFTGTLSGKIAKPGTEPTPYKQVPPVMEPAGRTHIPADVMAEYQASRITPEQAQASAIPYTAEQIAALERTGGMVPYSDNVGKATGAILAEPYTSFRGYLPDVALAGVGGLLTGGIGGAIGLPALNLLRKGYQAYDAAKTATAANELGNLKFTPLSAEQRAALNAVNMQPGTPGFDFRTASQAANMNVAGPVRPQPPAPAPSVVTTQAVNPDEMLRLEYNPTQPVMYASETGIVGKTPNEVIQADLAQRYAPQPVAPVVAAAPEMPVAPTQSDINKQNVMDMIRAKQAQSQTSPAPAAAPAPVVELTPSEQIMAAVPDMTKKSHAEIRFDIGNTAKASITTKDKVVQLDKAPFDEIAAQYGATINWSNMPKLSSGIADAREQVRKFVWDEIKTTVGPEKRGPQRRTLEKQATAEEQARLAAMTPEERAADAAAKQAEEAALSEQLKNRQSKLLGAMSRGESLGMLKPPKGTSQMMSGIPESDFTKDLTMAKMSGGDLPIGSFEKDGIRYEILENAAYKNMPDDLKKLVPDMPKTVERQVDIATGKVIKGPKSLAELQAEAADMLRKAKQGQNKPDVSEMAQAQVGNVIFDKDAPVRKTQRPDITSAKIVDTPAFKQVYDSQADWAFDNTFAEMTGEPLSGKYLNADKTKVIEVIPNKRYDPTDPDSVKQFPEIAYDVKTGDRAPIGNKWTENDPAPVETYNKARNINKPYDMVYEADDGTIWTAKGNFKSPPKVKIDPDVKVTDTKRATIFDDVDETQVTLIEGVNKKNGNIVEIHVLDSNKDANGVEFNYREFASGKLPKALFKNVPFRQTTLGTEVVDQVRFVPLKNGKPIIENGKVKTEIYYDRLKENLDE